MKAKRPTLRHIVIKMAKVKNKETILKAAREKWLGIYKGNYRLSVDFLEATVIGQKGVTQREPTT